MIFGFAWAYADDVGAGCNSKITVSRGRWLGCVGYGNVGPAGRRESCEGYGNVGPGNLAGDAFTRTP